MEVIVTTRRDFTCLFIITIWLLFALMPRPVAAALPGYGKRQSDVVIRNVTVGKATETVRWDQVKESVTFAGKKIKMYLLGVIYTSG